MKKKIKKTLELKPEEWALLFYTLSQSKESSFDSPQKIKLGPTRRVYIERSSPPKNVQKLLNKMLKQTKV